MNRLRIYVDTSVIGGCKDEEFALESEALLEMARNGQIVLLLSKLLLDELLDAPDNVTRLLDTLPENAVERLTDGAEAKRLRDIYLAENVVGPKSKNDAHHVALATVATADLIVSWNFKHIVHWDKIRGFNAINLREGYTSLEIRSPREFV